MGRPGGVNNASDTFGKKYALCCVSATVAESVTYPLDITKTRLQIQGEHATKRLLKGTKHVAYRGMVKTAVGIVREEGLSKLFQGLAPAVMRHLVYTGCRMMFYEYSREHILKKDSDGYFPVWKSVIGGMTSGALAQFFASPTDLVKVQMQTEGKKMLVEGRPSRYHGPLHAFWLISRENGLLGLWRGWLPNVQRAALVNLGDLVTYDTVKHFLLRNTSLEDNYFTHTLSSVCSGLVAATFGTPADVVKTRIMNNPDLYKGSLDCLVRSVQKEGFFSIYKGFVPTWSRMAPWSLTFWLTYEQIRRLSGATSF